MKGKKYKMKSKMWVYPGMAGWRFMYIGKRESAEIRKSREGKKRRGWGSVRVRATIGKTSWDTSIFPDKDGPYLLPIKLAVRKAEGIMDDDIVTLSITLRE